MPRRLVITVILGLCAGGCTSLRVIPPQSAAASAETQRSIAAVSAAVSADAFQAERFTASNGIALPYRILRPSARAGAGPFPLLVIFHGSGAIGTDNLAQVGPLAKHWATAETQSRFPAVVLIPQFPARTANYAPGADGLPRSQPTPELIAGLELVEHARATERVREVFAIGFSMGGSAIWSALVLKPSLFDAAAIVAGVPNPDAFRSLHGRRVLLVHGDADRENPFDAAWAAYQHAGGQMDFWRFSGLAHEFPGSLIVSDDLARWLWKRRR